MGGLPETSEIKKDKSPKEAFARSGMDELGRFCLDETGANAIEYSLIVAFIAMVIVGGVSLFGKALSEMMVTAGVKFP